MSRSRRPDPTIARPELVAFGQRLRSLREARGLSQRWVGREAGVSSPEMTFLEAGRVAPRADNLERLADVLGVTMDELWRGGLRGV